MSDPSQGRKPTPIGGTPAPSTADRVKQIQDLQRMTEAAPVTKKPTAAPAQPLMPSAKVDDLWNVQVTARTTNPLLHKATPKEQAVFGKAQVEPAALFGTKAGGVEILGNPWKIISFADTLPIVFEPPRDLKEYDARIPEKAVKTEHGLLFQASLAAKDESEPTRTRAVLVSDKGALVGAECESAFILDRLIKRLPSLPLAQAVGGERFKVTDGKNARFQVTTKSGKVFEASNFGLLIPKGQPPAKYDLVVAHYHLDTFDAAR